MGRIVNGGVRRTVLEHTKAADSRRWQRKQIAIGNRETGQIRLAVYGRSIEQLNADLVVVQEHFGLNKTDSLRVALHLVAKGIKEGRFNV